MCFKGSFFPSLLRLHTLSVLLLPACLTLSLPQERLTSLFFLTPSGFSFVLSVCGAKCLSLQPSESPWSLLYIPWLIAAIEKWKPNLGKDLDVIEKEGFTLARTAVNRKAKLGNFFFFFFRRWGGGQRDSGILLCDLKREREKYYYLWGFSGNAPKLWGKLLNTMCSLTGKPSLLWLLLLFIYKGFGKGKASRKEED